jgi:hypothetical protein
MSSHGNNSQVSSQKKLQPCSLFTQKKHANSSDTAQSGGKGTKRKGDVLPESEGADGGDSSQSSLLAEVEHLSRYILSSVRECCAQDSSNFVDEVRIRYTCFSKLTIMLWSSVDLRPQSLFMHFFILHV